MNRTARIFALAIALFFNCLQSYAYSIGNQVLLDGYGRGLDESGRVLLTRETSTTVEDWLWSSATGYSLVFARNKFTNEEDSVVNRAAGPIDWFHPSRRTDILPILETETEAPYCALTSGSCAGEFFVPSIIVDNLNFSLILGHDIYAQKALGIIRFPVKTELRGANTSNQLLIRASDSLANTVYVELASSVPEPQTVFLLAWGSLWIPWAVRRTQKASQIRYDPAE